MAMITEEETPVTPVAATATSTEAASAAVVIEAPSAISAMSAPLAETNVLQDEDVTTPPETPAAAIEDDAAGETAESALQTGAFALRPASEADTQNGSDEPDLDAGDTTNPKWHFRLGFAEDTNRRWRRTMEDAHASLSDFGDIAGQGFFGIYDGHAGKQVADYCSKHLHEIFLDTILKSPELCIPEAFDKAFTAVDSALVAHNLRDAGCTAVTAFLRSEGEGGQIVPVDQRSPQTKRILYTANVGDARAVLCRGGQAIRLSYDHKGSDESEVRRIVDAGGFVFNERVNGILAVTRSIGDMPMKDFVISNPYTTETILGDRDEFLILACDGIWDVISDQEAVTLLAPIADPQEAAQVLLKTALDKLTTDNLSVLIVRFE